jgi:hypothetical protein
MWELLALAAGALLAAMTSLFGAMKDKCAQSRQAQQNGCHGLLLPKALSVDSPPATNQNMIAE